MQVVNDGQQMFTIMEHCPPTEFLCITPSRAFMLKFNEIEPHHYKIVYNIVALLGSYAAIARLSCVSFYCICEPLCIVAAQAEK